MQKRTIDLLTESYKDQMTARRKYEFKDANGVVKANLYFKPLTRDDRVRAQAAANTDDALTISTYLLCKNAENEDGSKAFSPADAPNLQRELPENVLNEIELFMFDIKLDVDTICLHGDNKDSVILAKKLKNELINSGCEIKSLPNFIK